MPTFDQRGQKVNYQFNAAGNINFSLIQNIGELANQMRLLQAEIQKAVSAGVISNEIGVDVETKIKKALINIEKPSPDKNLVLENLKGAQELLKGVATAAGLVTSLIQAAEMVRRFLE